MKKVSVKGNASFLVGIQRAGHFMNTTYCLCLTIESRKFEENNHSVVFYFLLYISSQWTKVCVTLMREITLS